MKYKLILRYTIVAGAIILTMGSCKKNFGDENTNPDATNTAVTSALLTNVLSNMAAFTWDAGGITTISGLYSQYFSETQYTDVSIFTKQSLNWDDYFAPALGSSNANSYTATGYLASLNDIIIANTTAATMTAAAANGSNADQIAIARILKVYIFSILTNIYGDIPYSKVFQSTVGITPFDKQQDIYTDMFKELSEAVAQFDGGATVSGDILFGGDEARWKKFANSLHALLAIQLSKVDPTTGKNEFAAALSADGGVLESGDDVELPFPGGNFLSPIYKYYDVTKRFDYAVSATMTGWLAGKNDPRGLPYIYGTSTVGFPFGLSRNDAVNFANNNVGFAQLMKGAARSTGTDPFPILMASEIYLARAEAAELGWTGEDAASMYSSGIRAGWDFWSDGSGSFNDAAFTAYMANTDVSLSSGNVLQKINEQEWAASYPAGVRGWNVWRRTGYPELTGGPAAVTAGHAIPRRIAYGPSTYSYNASNTNAAAQQYTVQGDLDSQLGRMWWDVQ